MKKIFVAMGVVMAMVACNNSDTNKNGTTDSTRTDSMYNTPTMDTGNHMNDTSSYNRMNQRISDSGKQKY
jgi:hypothetical protein